MNHDEIIQAFDQYVLKTYTREPIIFVKGKGSTLIDIHGKKYLDFFPGWGVSNVGHCHPKVMNAVRDQIDTLIHIPNNFMNIPQAKLAKEIIRTSFKGKVFFCNSGAEANEGAIKFARKFGYDTGGRFEVITMNRSFHGRTMGALTATAQTKLHTGFGPLPDGFKYADFNNLDSVRGQVTDQTVAIMLELVQGEGGVNIASPSFIKGLRELCDKHNLLLIADEVQTGLGRTGTMYGFEQYGIEPDIMTLAKGLGGGLPIGAFVVQDRLASYFQPGMHGSTFAGSPIVCKAALGVFKAIHQDKMLRNAKSMGLWILEQLQEMKKRHSVIKDVRGIGLMIGIELTEPGAKIFHSCLNKGLIINCTQGNILRMLPALNITRKQAKRALYILDEALSEKEVVE